ncbi:MAG TPA: hypothetical protein VHX14_18895 [Thermoanaerobaculia bacterium]|jgi:hypothetical protein|nr:hypothetical protein [Thermoanaerobaculia bacterium]
MTDSVFANAVEPLTPRQRRLIIVLAIVVAATRFVAVSHSMWDWDEALFASALQHYDVAQHHPHPPGFPLFFGLAKLVRFVVHDEFHALRAVSVFASLFVFPAFFALARSLRFRFRTCALGATLFCFLPNVWYWGGTGFTDELALVTALAGAALLLRDDRRRRTYIGGCLFFAATMLVRAQNVLLLWPWIEASWRRIRAKRTSDVVAGTALIVVLVLTGYGIAAKLTGFAEFAKVTAEHQHYIATVDGALNPGRIPMANLLQDFLFDPFESRAASTALFGFALLSFARPRRAHAVILLTFLPNFFLAWFLLSPSGISRLSLGYIAFDVLLAADGMDVVASFLASRARAVSREQVASALQVLFAAIVVGRYVVWVWPGLEEVRLRDSPPVQAMSWIRQNVPRGATIQVSSGLDPFAAYFLADYKIVSDLDRSTTAGNIACSVTDRIDPSPQAINFQRPRQHLWALFNRRYFEVSVRPRESRVGSRMPEQ